MSLEELKFQPEHKIKNIKPRQTNIFSYAMHTVITVFNLVLLFSKK